MSLLVYGVSHKTAPIDIREQVAIGPEQLPEALDALRRCEGVDEALILSTCNRTEIVCGLDSGSSPRPLEWLARHQGLQSQVLEPHLYSFTNEFAVRHLLRVASGLDSMVLGEPQILGQLKQAYRAAVDNGTVGKYLNKLLQHSFSVAKRIRSETGIGDSPISVAYVAVLLACQIHGDLSDKRALLIGAGDTISLVAEHLNSRDIGEIVVANRSFDKAETLAARYGGQALRLDEMPQHLSSADIIVTSTGSRLPVITHGAVQRASQARRHAPMFIVDLAVPRDVEASVAGLDDVFLYGVDDLNGVIKENLKSREMAASQAEEMINLRAQDYMSWLQSHDSMETIVAYRQQADAIREQALAKAERRLAAGDAPEKVLSSLARNLTNTLIHHPTSTLREAGAEDREALINTARELFGLK